MHWRLPLPVSPLASDFSEAAPTDPSGPPFTGVDWTSSEHLEERSDVQALLVLGELEVLTELTQCGSDIPFTVDLVRAVHHALFRNVWPEYAGVLRGFRPGEWPYVADIGGIGYGSPPERVEVDLQRMVDEAQRYFSSLDAAQHSLSHAEVRSAALAIGAWLHCAIDRIHPFVNGNGRTSRAMAHYVLCRYGCLPLDWDRGRRSDYYAMFRLYFRESVLGGFTCFMHRLQFLQDVRHVQLAGDVEFVPDTACSPVEARRREREQRRALAS